MNLLKLLNPKFLWEKRSRMAPVAKTKLRAWSLDRRARGLPGSPSRRRLEAKMDRLRQLRNSHRGRRCFIICNGPSLSFDDLNRLTDEVTIASNKIFLAFDRTPWRPTFFTVCDLQLAENNREEINRLGVTKIVDLRHRSIFDDSDDFLYFKSGSAGYYDLAPFRFSEDFSQVVHGGYTVTYPNLQLAYYLGCREIYLLGLDFSFQIPSKRTYDPAFGELLISEGERNHFIENYRKPGEVWTLPRLDLQELAYRKAKEFLESHDCRVYNASRKTELDVFPRADFDTLFGDSPPPRSQPSSG